MHKDMLSPPPASTMLSRLVASIAEDPADTYKSYVPDYMMTLAASRCVVQDIILNEHMVIEEIEEVLP